MLDKKEAKKIAEPVVRQVVNCIADKRYGDLSAYVSFSENGIGSLECFIECVEGFLEINDLPHIDKFEAPCNFHPQYEYEQLSVYPYRDETGFAVDYDLTTDSEPNDLTLQMTFLWTQSHEMQAFILDAHIL